MTKSYAVITAETPRPAHSKKKGVRPEDACIEAEGLLLKAGFVFARASRLSESRYFQFPGRHGVIRVATHKKAARNPNMADGPTIASITFSLKAARADGTLPVTDNYVEWQTATAIGLYMLRAPLTAISAKQMINGGDATCSAPF